MSRQNRKPIFDEFGNPNYGLCHHGEANGFCDRGGCDEFFVHLEEEEQRERDRYKVKFATPKQIAFLRSLVKIREVKVVTPATSEYLCFYLGRERKVDPNAEYVQIATNNPSTVCYYDIDHFNKAIKILLDKLDNGEQVIMSEVSLWIKTYERFPKKSANASQKPATATPATTKENPATAKQLGFIKSLKKKRVVSDEVARLLDENPELTSKVASKVIGLLLESPETSVSA